MKFNEKLTKLRKMEGLSQEELGYRLNVTRQTVSKWELGQTTPEMDKLVELGKIFNISVDDLLNDSEVQSAKTIINEKDPVSKTEENVQEPEKQEAINNESEKENITNKENVYANSYTAPKDENHKREMCIMIVLGILFVITLAFIISKGYEMISEKFDVLNPKEKVEQIDEVEEETQIANNSNEVTNKVQENKVENSVNELDDTNTILENDKNSAVTETSNSIEQSDVSDFTEKSEPISSQPQQSSTGTISNQGSQSQVQQPSTTTPTTEVPSSIPQTSTSVVIPPSASNFDKEFELTKFNSGIEMYAGSSNGFHVKSLLDQIITKNKTGARKITVNACGVETQDETTIRNLKGNFGDFENCEVILDYDGEGFVTKVRIQK